MQVRTSARTPEKTVSLEVCQTQDYRRVKKILNAARHPTFLGRATISSCALNGGVNVYMLDGEDVAVSVVNPRLNTLLALSVVKNRQGVGIGEWVLRYVQTNFARVIAERVPYFEKRGYVTIGKPTRGKKLITRTMVKESLIGLAGRLRGRLEVEHKDRLAGATVTIASRESID